MTELPSSLSSPTELGAVISELRGYAKWFSHTDIKRRTHAKHATPPPALSPPAHELLRAATGKKLLSMSVLDGLIKDLQAMQRSAPVIHITLAVPASAASKQALVAACRSSIDKGALVTFAFNATLLGGMVISYGSHVFDWSFRRRILSSRHRFAEVLRHV